MDGTVIGFHEGKWEVQTSKEVLRVQDWQCHTGMMPGKRVLLLYKKGNKSDGHWQVYATEGDGSGR